ncbi:23S rRNA (cytidine(2498)-2'-O)-methyltransferase RlmM [Gammaproteobacteria bacterium AB-CW1]|uniref:23S rRNA (Cytidine(2498)-2'-O)-methyltransferase RlmM n=1 Tax=Natronospira elongata TaxID=3110268 RepID=A0AAP6MK39_9GAMM|nr:23S rRNA (cytidine(2498)-2'-O)-methyltransferase RlmM [Gammaproteobacteria bacterium AB-CW1]
MSDNPITRPPVHAWLAHCRPGMESAAAAELDERARAAGIASAYAIARPGEAWLRLVCADPAETAAMNRHLPQDYLFPRQVLREWHWLEGLPGKDRISPIIETLPGGSCFGGLQISVPDSNAGKGLSRFVRAFTPALRRALKDKGIRLDAEGAPVLHLFFPDSTRVAVGSNQDPAEPAGGIQRLRMPSAAPSRSTLKLEEALIRLMTPEERETHLQPGMTAVDLGAAPGGWSWQMVRRHIHVTAVDNGPMAKSLLDSGLLDHVRGDGFTWQPAAPVDWLLCDMVDKPARVAARMGQWLQTGWARRVVFNLKLPMKRPWPVARDLLAELRARAGAGASLRARQLYHDREEITVLILP